MNNFSINRSINIGKYDDGLLDLSDNVSLEKKATVNSKSEAIDKAKSLSGSEIIVERNDKSKGLSYDVYKISINDTSKKIHKLQDAQNLKLFDNPIAEIEKQTGTSNSIKGYIVAENGEVSKPIYKQQFSTTKYEKVRDSLALDDKKLWHRVVDTAMSMPSDSDSLSPIDSKELNNLKQHVKAGDILLNGNDGSFIHGILYVGKDPELQAKLEEKWSLPKGSLKDEAMIIHSLVIDEDTTIDNNGKKELYKAGGTGVIIDTLERYTKRHPRDVMIAVSVKGSTDQDRKSAIDAAKSFVGKNYDRGFNTYDDKEMYCTETVMKAWLNSSNPPEFPTQKHALFPYPKSVIEYMPEKMKQTMKDDGRLHQEMIMTDGIATSPSMELVWANQNADKSEFFKKHSRWADGMEGKLGDNYKSMVSENMPVPASKSKELTEKIKELSNKTRVEMSK